MLNKQLHKLRLYSPILLVLVMLLVVVNLAVVPRAFAGTFTNSSLTELGGASNVNPMIAGDGQSLALAFTPATTTATNPTITITFTGWTGSSAGTVNATQTISNTGCTALTGATAGIPGTLAASGSGAVLTISSTGGSNTLNSGTTYCTELTSTSAVTNPAAAGTYSVTISDGSDSITQTIDVLSSGANGYTIGATVGSTFTMSLSGTTDTFSGNLSSIAVTTSTGATLIASSAYQKWPTWDTH